MTGTAHGAPCEGKRVLATTQVAEKRVCRSRNATVGGVCAGLADRFDLDPIVVRILAVFITILTAGLGLVAYAVLWARLPRGAESVAPYEVTPESAESSAFGSVDCATGRVAGECRESNVSGMSLLARLAVAVGLVLLFLLVSFNVSPLVPGTEWWQFWPIAFMMTGLFLIVIPVPTAREMAWHAFGIVLTAAAATVLPISLGIMSWQTVPLAFSQLWFLPVIAVLMFAFGMYRKNDALVVCASFVFVLFCLGAFTICALPGDASTLLLHMPDGRSVRIIFVEG